jgi:cystathionine gamma-synthase
MSRPDGFETRAIHAGQPPDPTTGAVIPPISVSTTFAQEAPGRPGRYEYARSANPTREALETCLASLEGGREAFAFSSGMAAEDTLARALLRPGDHVLLGRDAYGGTLRLFSRVLAETGITWSSAPLTDPGALAGHWPEGTRLVWVETPSNPRLEIVDVAAVAEVAHRRGARVVVDNTFATPYLQQPLRLGADAVVHSATKYLGGHSDVVAGAVVTDDPELAERVRFLQNATGAVPGPFDCFLLLRGIKTLAVRMDRHCANATAVADLLAAHPAVARVVHPGRPDHPGHAVAARQMRGFGGMVAAVLAGGEDAAVRLVTGTRLFTLAESLGGVESLIEHPARMTHAGAVGTDLAVEGGLVRLSVGIETLDDLLDDLRGALDGLGGAG